MLAITDGADEALQHIKDNLEDFPEEGGLRITQAQTDDGDAEFTLEVVQSKEEGDVVIDGHPIPVYLAQDVCDDLAQSALDGETHGDHVHFGIVDLSEVGPEDASSDDED